MKKIASLLLTFLLAFTVFAIPVKAYPAARTLEIVEDGIISTGKNGKGISVKEYQASNELGVYSILYIKNTSKEMKDISGTFKFYNGKKLIGTSGDSATALSPGKTAILEVKVADNATKCKYKLAIRKSIYKYGNNKLEITETGGDSTHVIVSVKNNAKKKEYVNATVIFFKGGECVGFGYSYVPDTHLPKGEEAVISVNNWLDTKRTYDDYLISIEGRYYKR